MSRLPNGAAQRVPDQQGVQRVEQRLPRQGAGAKGRLRQIITARGGQVRAVLAHAAAVSLRHRRPQRGVLDGRQESQRLCEAGGYIVMRSGGNLYVLIRVAYAVKTVDRCR